MTTTTHAASERDVAGTRDTLRALVSSAVALAGGALCYPLRASVPHVVRGQLSDLLWACAFACALLAVTRSARWGIVGLVVAEILELAQLHPEVPGTFDPLDLVAIAAGFAAGAALERVGRTAAPPRFTCGSQRSTVTSPPHGTSTAFATPPLPMRTR